MSPASSTSAAKRRETGQAGGQQTPRCIRLGSHYERNVGKVQNSAKVITKYCYAQLGRMKRLLDVKKNGTLCYIVPGRVDSTVRVATFRAARRGWVRYHAFVSDWASGGTASADKRFTGQTPDASRAK